MEALMDQVADDREPIVIRRRGKEPVALIAADDLESLVEVAELGERIGFPEE